MAEDDEVEKPPEKLDLHYQKSPLYRTIHVDGALGGPTARRYLAMTFYNERATVPRRTSRAITHLEGDTGSLGPEQVEETLGGIIRHLEVTALLDINAARELLVWLQDQVSGMEELLEVPPEHRVAVIARKEDE